MALLRYDSKFDLIQTTPRSTLRYKPITRAVDITSAFRYSCVEVDGGKEWVA